MMTHASTTLPSRPRFSVHGEINAPGFAGRPSGSCVTSSGGGCREGLCRARLLRADDGRRLRHGARRGRCHIRLRRVLLLRVAVPAVVLLDVRKLLPARRTRVAGLSVLLRRVLLLRVAPPSVVFTDVSQLTAAP